MQSLRMPLLYRKGSTISTRPTVGRLTGVISKTTGDGAERGGLALVSVLSQEGAAASAL